jgi:plasmid maintenance system antidote protein VapI
MRCTVRTMDSRTPLKRLMEDEGRRQNWLARATGIAEADISRMASRGMHPTQDEAQRIADALGRQVPEVFPNLVPVRDAA